VRLTAFVAFLAAMVLVGCESGGGTEVFVDPHGAIRVKPGTTFALSLPENPGVGFEWRLSRRPEGGVVQSTGDAHGASHAAPGSGGRHRFLFRARRTGRATVGLRESFRGRPRAERTVTVEVR